MNRSSFINVLRSKGYSQGLTGVWFSPDANHFDNGSVVTFDDNRVYLHNGKKSVPFSQTDIDAFSKAV